MGLAISKGFAGASPRARGGLYALGIITATISLGLCASTAAAAQVTTAATPSPAPATPSATASGHARTYSYVYPLTAQNGQPCDAATPTDTAMVQATVAAQLREISPVTDLPPAGTTSPIDPLAPAIKDLQDTAKAGGNSTNRGFPKLYKRNVVVTTTCRNGQVVQITSTGYVLIASVDEKIDLSKIAPSVQAGNTVTGTIAAVQAADWSTIYGDTKPKNVPFLPVFGDNADAINGQLEQRLPLVAPKDPANVVDLCRTSTYHLVVAGQGSLASQALDPYRTVLGVSTSVFTQPAPWAATYKAFGAAFALIGIPTSQEIKADVFYCDDDGLYSFGSADQGGPAFDITGHTRRFAIIADTGTKSAVLAYAATDLQNQLDCIIHRWAQNKFDANTSIYPPPPFSRVGQSRWCGIKGSSNVKAIPGYFDQLWSQTDKTKWMIPIVK